MTETTWAELVNNSKNQLEPVPPGDYDVRVLDASEDKSSTGKLMIRVKFEIITGPHAPRKIPTQFVLSDENPMALAIFFRHMQSMGLNADFFSQLPPPVGDSMLQAGAMIASALLNRQCRVTLGIRAWQGVDRNEVKAVLPPLGGVPVAPGTVTGVATPGGPVAPGATSIPSPTSTPTSMPARRSPAPSRTSATSASPTSTRS